MRLLATLCIMLVSVVTTAADYCNMIDIDFWGGNLASTKTNSFGACKQRCKVNSRCRGVTWIDWGIHWGRCYLKQAGHGKGHHCAWCRSAQLGCEELRVTCPVGSYRTSDKSCGKCQQNTYSKGGSSWGCTSCPPGQYSNAGASSCTKCPVGQYNGKSGSGCVKCPQNSYSNIVGATSCNRCRGGYVHREGATSCTPCPVGTYNRDYGTGCEICPLNTFNDKVGQTTCRQCSAGYISAKGSPSAKDCYEPLNGAYCWRTRDTIGNMKQAMIFEEASRACSKEADCIAATCQRNASEKTTASCYVGKSVGEVVKGNLCRFPKVVS